MKNDKRNYLIIGLTIVMIVIWIASNLYHIAVTSTVPDNLRETITPFDPQIDMKTIERLRSKKSPEEFSVSSEVPIQAISATESGKEATKSASN
jgi:hypothetical protein